MLYMSNKFAGTVEMSVVHSMKFVSQFLMSYVGGGRKLTLDFTCGQTCKHGFSLLSNHRWKTHTTIIRLHMPLILPPLTLGTFADITQVPEYESVFLRLPPAMKSGACRRACKAHRPSQWATTLQLDIPVRWETDLAKQPVSWETGFEGINLHGSLQVVVNVDDDQCKFYDGS